MVRWNIKCPNCQTVTFDVECSMYTIPSCACGSERFLAHQGITPKSRVFPFDSKHVTPDGKPLLIESMHHLRKVEKEYGVVFSAFNNEQNNSIDPLQGELPRYRGEDEDFQRNHRH